MLSLHETARLVLVSSLVCWASALNAQQPGKALFPSPPAQRMAALRMAQLERRDEDDFEKFVQSERGAPPRIEVANKSIRELTVDIRTNEGELPKLAEQEAELPTALSVYPPLRSSPLCVHWRAPANYHGQLYFDDPRVERHGQSYHPLMQPALTTARFIGTTALLPVKVITRPPQDLTYTLGYGRPSYSWISRELTPILSP